MFLRSRGWHLSASLVAAAALAGMTPPAAAADDWSVEWSNGFKVESGDQAFKLEFGGRIQADYTFAGGDDVFAGALEGGFEFRRARLFFAGTVYERIKFKAEYDFAGGSADFKDVWIGLLTGPGELRFGHYKEYFSLEELTSSNHLAFLERSMPVAAFAPSRNSGVGFHGSSGDRVDWGLGAFYDSDDFGVSNAEDRVNLTGRVAFRPIWEDGGKRMLHLGLGVSGKDAGTAGTLRFRARPEAHFTSRFVDTGSFAAAGALLVGFEAAGVFDRFWFAVEGIQNEVDAPAVGDPSFSGYYVQAGYFLTPDHRRYKTGAGAFDRQKPGSTWGKDGGRGAWELAVRLSSIDLSDKGVAGGEQDNVTLGVNWYPNSATRLMINFVNADVDGVGDANFVLVRWQVDF